MELPRSVVVGHDALLQSGEVCRRLKLGKKALIVADPTTMKIAGETVATSLGLGKIKVGEYLIPDATIEAVKAAEAGILDGGYDESDVSTGKIMIPLSLLEVKSI